MPDVRTMCDSGSPQARAWRTACSDPQITYCSTGSIQKFGG